MKSRLLTAFLVLVGFLSGGYALWWTFTPRLLDVSPAPGSVQVPTRAQLRLTFTRPLSLPSIQARLTIQPDQPGSLAWEGNTLVFMPSLPWAEEAEISIQLRSGGRAQGFPGLPLREGKSWSFQVGQVSLAYLWPSDGPADLYSLNLTTGDVRRLSQNANILDFSLGSGASSIYFSSNNGPSGSRILRLDLSQELVQPGQPITPTVVIDCPQALCRLVLPSPDGAWLAYERIPLEDGSEPPPGQVWLYSIAEQRSLLAGEAGHNTDYPAWCSNGWLAIFDKQIQGYSLFLPPNGARLTLSNQTGEAGACQPGGAAFVATEIFLETSGLLEPLASSHLIRYMLSSGKLVSQVDISQAFDLEDSAPVFSPDGSKVALSRRYLDPGRWTPGRQLWLMNADGSQAQPLTDAAALNHHGFTWKPDGTQIAFVRSDPTQLAQPPELWTINADGSHLLQLVIGGYAPLWIP